MLRLIPRFLAGSKCYQPLINTRVLRSVYNSEECKFKKKEQDFSLCLVSKVLTLVQSTRFWYSMQLPPPITKTIASVKGVLCLGSWEASGERSCLGSKYRKSSPPRISINSSTIRVTGRFCQIIQERVVPINIGFFQIIDTNCVYFLECYIFYFMARKKGNIRMCSLQKI